MLKRFLSRESLVVWKATISDEFSAGVGPLGDMGVNLWFWEAHDRVDARQDGFIEPLPRKGAEFGEVRLLRKAHEMRFGHGANHNRADGGLRRGDTQRERAGAEPAHAFAGMRRRRGTKHERRGGVTLGECDRLGIRRIGHADVDPTGTWIREFDMGRCVAGGRVEPDEFRDEVVEALGGSECKGRN